MARVGAVVLPLGLAALLVPFRVTFAAPAAALLLVAVIVGVATLGERMAGYLATVVATLSFDFFLTQPYERLEITHRADLETAICLFLVGVVVTEIAMQSKRLRPRRAGAVCLRRSHSLSVGAGHLGRFTG